MVEHLGEHLNRIFEHRSKVKISVKRPSRALDTIESFIELMSNSLLSD